MTAGKNGKPVSSANYKIQSLNVVCNTLNVHPDAFLQDIDASVALLKELEGGFKAGETRHTHQFNDNIDFGAREITHYVLSARNFI